MASMCRILNVDDHNDSREMVNFMLRNSDLNCEIVSADCAESAISLIENQLFDLYILDYSLPAISGVELCRYIRKRDSKSPIVFFSAMARDIDRKTAIKSGASDYLVKPNDLDNLTETVNRLLIESSSSNCASLPKTNNYNGIY